MRRTYSIFWLVLLVILPACGQKLEINETESFVVAERPSEGLSEYSCEGIRWATEHILVVTLRNRKVQGFDSKSGKEIWSKEFEENIDAIATGKSHVFVALSGSIDGSRPYRILRFNAETGDDLTPPGVPEPFLTHAMEWIEEMDSLCVLMDEGISIYSTDLQTVTKKISYEGHPFFSATGTSVLLAERSGSCTRINLESSELSLIHGPPHVESSMVAMDAPFLSNAFANGGKLIRVVDNSWTTGTVSFHDGEDSEPVTADSENGHAIAAVHWPTQRLAISGTEENLLIFDTEGTKLGRIKHAVTERTYAMAFSPSGNQIAT